MSCDWSIVTCDGWKIKRNVPERINGGGDSLAHLAHHVTLQLASEDRVHDAGALRWLNVGSVDQVTMKKIKSGNEELMSILLLIPS